ncbi:MAG TPA: hypothetical protein VFL99_06320 [Segeticoccus sp.]|uniref:hypothetical protein n=1 Tax=Segeticoccus sp. TaxID=2706531 RepID=UPI002D7F3F46|nr:hypothetical protein [Segeticoccus sp.]HET8599922.1 hypothetical protein [Segeticoccus sp.]
MSAHFSGTSTLKSALRDVICVPWGLAEPLADGALEELLGGAELVEVLGLELVLDTDGVGAVVAVVVELDVEPPAVGEATPPEGAPLHPASSTVPRARPVTAPVRARPQRRRASMGAILQTLSEASREAAP